MTISLAEESHPLPDIPATILSRMKVDRQWRLLVRNADPDWITHWQTDKSLPAVDVRTPSLEEFFLGYMRNGSEERVGERGSGRVEDKTTSPVS